MEMEIHKPNMEYRALSPAFAMGSRPLSFNICGFVALGALHGCPRENGGRGGRTPKICVFQ